MSYFTNTIELDLSIQKYLELSDLSLMDLEAIRLILRGDSVVDWHRLNFESREQVDNFLRVNLFDPESLEDQRRFRYLHQESVQYLRNHFNLRIPEPLLDSRDIYQLFLHASFSERRFNRLQLLGCMILKVMTILHHIEARSLLFRMPVSYSDLYLLVQERVDAFYDAAQRANVPLVHIYGSRKSRDSLITKLLSKRDTIAATVFDKLRFRLVVERHEDLAPVLAYMTHTFVPFNYTLPSESTNNLLSIRECLEQRSDLSTKMDGFLSNYRAEEEEKVSFPGNAFSGATYQMINFIVDLPIRLDSFLNQEDVLRYGRIAFVLVEFQMVDQSTEEANAQGENSHERYKKRQYDRVLQRLRWGGGLRALRQRRSLMTEGGDHPSK